MLAVDTILICYSHSGTLETKMSRLVKQNQHFNAIICCFRKRIRGALKIIDSARN